MQWRIGAHRLVEALSLSLLIEEAVLMALRYKEVELEIATGKLLAARDGRPLAESDRLTVSGAICQRIAADNILLQHISEAFFIACRSALLADLANHLTKQPFSASFGIVGQDVDAIAGTHGDKALEFPLRG